nr:MAG TPA: hypothetical protein [Caudoviricetes sp.]
MLLLHLFLVREINSTRLHKYTHSISSYWYTPSVDTFYLGLL